MTNTNNNQKNNNQNKVKKCLRHINPLAPTHGGIRASLLLLFRA